MAINVVIANDDLTVLGPPASIDLQVDVGPQGSRGSYVYSGFNDPNVVSSPFVNKAPAIGDLFFRTSNNYIYQYVSIPGGEQWEVISSISPSLYNEIKNITFSAGSGSTSIFLNNITLSSANTLELEDFIIQLTSNNNNPATFSISNKTITTGATPLLLLEFVGAEYSGGSWSSFSGSVDLNITINSQ